MRNFKVDESANWVGLVVALSSRWVTSSFPGWGEFFWPLMRSWNGWFSNFLSSMSLLFRDDMISAVKVPLSNLKENKEKIMKGKSKRKASGKENIIKPEKVGCIAVGCWDSLLRKYKRSVGWCGQNGHYEKKGDVYYVGWKGKLK